MNKKTMIVFAGTVLIVGALSFWGGTKYAPGALSGKDDFQNARGNFAGNTTFKNGGGQQTLSNNQVRPLTGEIISNDEGSLTLKLGDGGSKTVFLPESTKITKSVEGGIVDLTEGINIVVSGKEDASGNYSASSVQVIEGGLRTDLSDE